jgi:hypothetical protein
VNLCELPILTQAVLIFFILINGRFVTYRQHKSRPTNLVSAEVLSLSCSSHATPANTLSMMSAIVFVLTIIVSKAAKFSESRIALKFFFGFQFTSRKPLRLNGQVQNSVLHGL